MRYKKGAKVKQTSKSKFEKIIEIDEELNRIRDLDILMEKILHDARKVTNAEAGSIYIVKGNQLMIKCSQNELLEKSLPPNGKLVYSFFEYPISEATASGWVAANKVPLMVPDMYHLPKNVTFGFNPAYDQKSGYKTVSTFNLPLVSNQDEVLGVLQLINARNKDNKIVPFNEEDKPFVMHFASTATLALQRAQMTRTLLLRMIRMAGLRDPKETGAHVNRVGAYSVELYEAWAKNRNHPYEKIEKIKDELRMVAMLHDIGKVAIPDQILKKPGHFNDEEYEIMKTHAWHGVQIIGDSQSQMDLMAIDVALRHHERWDGTGYPGKIDLETGKLLDPNDKAGLKGEEIPIFARVVSIADVYDALISHRIYKEAWNEDDVLKAIAQERGAQFDPELVDLFLDIMPTIRHVRERYPDQN